MKKFFVSATSSAWCGISVDLIVNVPDTYTVEDIQDNELLIAYIDDAMYEAVSGYGVENDEDDIEEEEDASWGWDTVEETTDPEMINCPAYENIDLTT